MNDAVGAVVAHLVVDRGLEALRFYEEAFGARVVRRQLSPDGGSLMHAELAIGSGTVYVADAFEQNDSRSPLALGGTPVFVQLWVDDPDAVWSRAIAAGADEALPLRDMFWGDRYGQIRDPFGHRWAIASHVRDVDAEEMLSGAAEELASATPPAAAPQSNADTVRRFFGALDRHEFDVIEDVLAADFIDHGAHDPGQADRQSVRAFYEMLYGAFPDLEVRIDDLVAAGDRVVVRKTSSGTHEGTFMGMEPTGRRMSIEIVNIFQFREGQIVAHWHAYDPSTIARQLGAG